MRISQPVAFTGETKRITARTMQGMAARVVDTGLAMAAEVERITATLAHAAADPDVLMSMPRTVQAWGVKR